MRRWAGHVEGDVAPGYGPSYFDRLRLAKREADYTIIYADLRKIYPLEYSTDKLEIVAFVRTQRIRDELAEHVKNMDDKTQAEIDTLTGVHIEIVRIY